MEKKALAIEELQFGMYVAALDRPWSETPFMFQGFHLRTDQQLAALRKLCKLVYIDMERSETAGARPPAPQFRIRGSAAYPEKANVEIEFRQARTVYEQSAAGLGDLLAPLSKPGGVLEGKEVKESVTRLTDSVVRNPDALLLVTRLRDKSAKAHARALQVSIYMIVFARFLALEREELDRKSVV